MLTALALGLALGLRHAFDPDHVIAVSTITAKHRSAWKAAWIGAGWGLGHGAALCLAGLALVALRVSVPTGLTAFFELCVALLLVLLGATNLWAARWPGSGAASDHSAGLHATLGRSSLLGVAHGLAGSAPIALLATAAMPTPATAWVFLAVFAAATTLGMVGFSVALGLPLARLGGGPGLRRFATAGTGLLSLAFGAWMVYAIGTGGTVHPA